jgi:hypothetical protein
VTERYLSSTWQNASVSARKSGEEQLSAKADS